MSSQSTFTSSSTSYSSTSTTRDGQTTGQSRSQHIVSDPSGTTVHSQHQNLGEGAIKETRQYDAQGRELVGGPGGNTTNRITDVDQSERDKEYEERIEEEYAKREGGA